jgi:DNA sulfur modification protein DndB
LPELFFSANRYILSFALTKGITLMTTVAAQELKMGSTTYYLTSLTAGELVTRVRTAEEALQDWDNLSIEDRIQRNINKKRLLEEIVPYLAGHPDRFFGSVIILLDGDAVFEPLTSIQSTPGIYAEQMKKIGFLTISSGNWIALDGQHRLVALRELITGNYTGAQLPGIMNDDISVLFIKQENTEKTRRLFNKVNRYARATSRADNLVLSEDDGYAIVSRKLFMNEDGPLHVKKTRGDDFVNWRNNTLSGRSLQFTTISALSLIVRDVCEANGLRIDEKSLGGVAPNDQDLFRAYELSELWIETAFKAFTVLHEVRENPSLLPEYRDLEGKSSLLLRPAGQISLFRAARIAMDELGQQFSIMRFMASAARLDWSAISPLWDNILVQGRSRILAKRTNYEDAAHLIVWLSIGDSLPNPERFQRDLVARWHKANPDTPLPDKTYWR